jgi:acetyl-CoA acetyltransferase
LLNRSHSRGTFGGTLKDIPAVELGASVISAALRRSGLRPDEIGMAVLGNTVQAGNKMNPARQAAIHGGLPVQVPAMTVNRVCGSGAQAILSAAHEILVGSVDTAIAGGMENMDAAPQGPLLADRGLSHTARNSARHFSQHLVAEEIVQAIDPVRELHYFELQGTSFGVNRFAMSVINCQHIADTLQALAGSRPAAT